METIELISAKLAALSPEHQAQVLDFVEFLLSKYPAPGRKKSAEERALERIKDIDDPSQWITVVEIDDPVNVESSLEKLKERGYQVKVPSQTP
ncbi:MAG: hypothetical protein VKN60_02765 [Cyanobacteriota bacterium]|nr:hypothetical protein [Cyanobacteriota bacterium]